MQMSHRIHPFPQRQYGQIVQQRTKQVTSNPQSKKKEIHPHYGNFQLVGHGFIAHAQ